MKRDDVLATASAWGHNDDWGVKVINVETLGDVLTWLEAGNTVNAIVAHAAHVTADCTDDCQPLLESVLR